MIRLTQLFPDQKFVLDHMAKPYIKDKKITEWETDMKELSKNANVYCKLSGMVTEADRKSLKNEDFIPYLEVVFDAFGVERLLFGSDWPVCLLAAQYNGILGIVENYIQDFPQKEQEMIMGVNACTIYNLEI